MGRKEKIISMPYIQDNLNKIKSEGTKLGREVRKKSANFLIAAFGFVAGLAWNEAITEAMQRLYPNEPVIDYSGSTRVAAPLGAVQLGVPISVLARVTRIPGCGVVLTQPLETVAVYPRIFVE